MVKKGYAERTTSQCISPALDARAAPQPWQIVQVCPLGSWQVQRVAVNGVQLHVEERGSGTAIVGIHGAGSSALFWEGAAERLADLGRVLTYDRRGCNRSELPAPYEVTSVREHADDVVELMRTLKAEPAILVGRSYGGTIALDVALRHPGSVLAIALLEAGPLGLVADYDAWFDELLALAEGAPGDRVGEAVMREVLGAWEELPGQWQAVFTSNGPALLAELRGGERTDNDRLSALAVPALVVTAEESPDAIRRCSEALAAALPGARSAVVAGGHAIDPAADDVRDFIRDVVEAMSH
jgi:pimeloyl-ACP methyl ester carboxylesterase